MNWDANTIKVLETITQVLFLGGLLVTFIVYRAVQTSKKDKDKEK